MKVGFVGLGIMGSRMAANLARKGFDLKVHNRTPERAEPLLEQGATWASSPAEAARGVDVLITMLSAPDAVREVALGSDGFLDALDTGALWLDCSTVNPSFSREMAAEAGDRGIRFVDAPVGGTKGPAEKGTLIILAGGSAEDVAECEPIFDAVGQRTVHAGGHGMGTSLKMVVNLMLGASMVLFTEAMLLGESLGLAREMLLAVIPGAPVTAPFISEKKDMIAAADHETHFPLRLMHKDMHLAALSAYERGVPLPTVNVVKEVYQGAVRAGLGDRDFAAVFDHVVGR